MISALLWHGLPSKLLRSALQQDVLFFSSSPLLAELSDVLSRPKLRQQIVKSRLSIAELIGMYSETITKVQAISVPRIAPDPDDDVVIGTAVAAKAHFIVTGDRPFLSISQYQGVRIITVGEALQSIAAR